MTTFNSSSAYTARLAATEHARGPYIVAMDTDTSREQSQAQEAHFLFFVAAVGIALNLLIIVMIGLRKPLRRMTSAFLAHAAVLNLIKAAFCIPFGLNLLSDADETDENQPGRCNLQGSAFIVIVTSSAVNMVAMICTEAYTFGEINVGGNSRGTTCCILFGLLVVYITSIILHLGPTLIGGDIVYNPDIGACAFRLGNVTGYIANAMWIVIITMAFVGVGHFLKKLYKEIQANSPNRISMLVRHSLTIRDDIDHKPSEASVQEMVVEATHRAKIFVMTAVAFALCWYPLFILILVDFNFMVNPKVYQAFFFIAWIHALVEPIILIFFDRNINLLSRFMYCDRDTLDAAQIAYFMNQSRQRDEAIAASRAQTNTLDMMMNDASTADAIPLTPLSRDSTEHAFTALDGSACRHCSPSHSFATRETTPLQHNSRARSRRSSPNTQNSSRSGSRGLPSPPAVPPLGLNNHHDPLPVSAAVPTNGVHHPVSKSPSRHRANKAHQAHHHRSGSHGRAGGHENGSHGHLDPLPLSDNSFDELSAMQAPESDARRKGGLRDDGIQC